MWQEQEDKQYNKNSFNGESQQQQSEQEYYQKHTAVIAKQQQQVIFPIDQLQHDKLIILGTTKAKLLTKISTVKIFPHRSVVNKYYAIRRNKKFNKKEKQGRKAIGKKLEKYWDKRFFLFQKFDEGIRLDEQSWYSVTPEAVAKHIAAKIKLNGSILDAFCGSGGDTIQLTSSCLGVVSNDIDPVKIECLMNNAKIYKVQHKVKPSCHNFFDLNVNMDLPGISQCQCVYLAPPWGGPDYQQIASFHPDKFQPSLSSIIEKALTISPNLVLNLPANTDVVELAAILAQKVMDINIPVETCTLRLERIVYNQKFKFILAYFGEPSVQSDVKLYDQLAYLYSILLQQQGAFPYKKLIKSIRRQIGMVKLLNYLFSAQMIVNGKNKNQHQQMKFEQKQLTLLQKLEIYLDKNGVVSSSEFERLKEQSLAEYKIELKHKPARNKRKRIKKYNKKTKQKQQHNQNAQSAQNQAEKKIQNQKDKLSSQQMNQENDQEQDCWEQQIQQ